MRRRLFWLPRVFLLELPRPACVCLSAQSGVSQSLLPFAFPLTPAVFCATDSHGGSTAAACCPGSGPYISPRSLMWTFWVGSRVCTLPFFCLRLGRGMRRCCRGNGSRTASASSANNRATRHRRIRRVFFKRNAASFRSGALFWLDPCRSSETVSIAILRRIDTHWHPLANFFWPSSCCHFLSANHGVTGDAAYQHDVGSRSKTTAPQGSRSLVSGR